MNNIRHSYKPQRLTNVKSRPIYVMEVKMILKARSQYWPKPGYLMMDCHGVGRGYPVSRFPLSFVEMAIKSFIRSSEEHWASQIVSGLSGGLEVDSTTRPKIKSAFYCFLDQEGCHVDIVQLTTQKMYIV